MAYIFGDGFDCYATTADAVAGYWDSGTPASMTLVAGRFAGSQATSWLGGGIVYLAKSSAVNDAVHHFVCAFRQTATLTAATLGHIFPALGWRHQSSVPRVSLGWRDPADLSDASRNGAGYLYRRGDGAEYVDGVRVRGRHQCHHRQLVGSQKRQHQQRSFSGLLNTRPGANNYANKLSVGMKTAVNAQHIDDFLWRSDASSVPWVGDMRCYTRMPASDASVQFSRVPTGVLTQTVAGGTQTTTGLGNTIARFTPIVAAYSGTVTGVSAATSTGNSGNMKCAIYADDGTGTRPGVVLASAVAPVTPVVGGTNAFTFSPGVPVVKGVTYWLAAMCDTAVGQWSVQNASTFGVTATASYATFPQNNPASSIGQTALLFSWTYTTTTANFQAVSEPQQDGTTSYVYDSTPGDADFYNIGAIASTPVATVAVTTRGFMQKSDAGTRTAAVQIKSGGTTVASPTNTLSSSFGWVWRTDSTDPATGTAWSATGVNNAQIGPVTVT